MVVPPLERLEHGWDGAESLLVQFSTRAAMATQPSLSVVCSAPFPVTVEESPRATLSTASTVNRFPSGWKSESVWSRTSRQGNIGVPKWLPWLSSWPAFILLESIFSSSRPCSMRSKQSPVGPALSGRQIKDIVPWKNRLQG